MPVSPSGQYISPATNEAVSLYAKYEKLLIDLAITQTKLQRVMGDPDLDIEFYAATTKAISEAVGDVMNEADGPNTNWNHNTLRSKTRAAVNGVWRG